MPHKERLDSYFIFSKTDDLKKYGEKNGAGSTFIEVSGKQISHMSIIIPEIEEQQKIGNFLKQLDDIITLQQHKLELLKQMKQGYLQKMFPKNEEDKPEIRFAGYTGAWEQRKFGDMVERVKSYSLSRDVETLEDTDIKYVHYGDIHTKVADRVTKLSNLPFIKYDDYEFIQKGDVIVADASEDYKGIATPSVIIEDVGYKLVAGLHTIALRPFDMDSVFLYYLMNSNSFRKHGYRVGTGMKVFGISYSNILNFETYFPQIDEQKKIGWMLLKIDDSIALHQHKLELLKQMKQGYLQKMFV
ncbi:type I restriction enzyme S subunit [Melissococcus plutonius]|nr:type I restriction enzyme S subunit [Melissococcus plutonius]